MSNDYETRLERRISAELGALPTLSAPPEIAVSVMLALAGRTPASSVFTASAGRVWSVRARLSLFLGLTVLSAGICFGLLQARQSGVVTSLAELSMSLAQVLGLIGGLVQTLFAACGIALRNLGAPVITALVAAAVLCYLTCVALGTVWYRVAFGHSANSR